MTRSVSQLSLVAFYGPKDGSELWDKIENIQRIIEAEIQDVYERYESDRIHGTIIGLEGAVSKGKIISKHYKELEGKEIELDIKSIIDFMLNTKLLPMTIRVGGFQNNDNEIFTSRGETPFYRMFSIQRSIIVAMGWPYSEGRYSPVLDTLRRGLSQFGGLHKYYDKPNSCDNDFFFVLGNLKAPLEESRKKELQSTIQQEMTTWKNITVEMNAKNIHVIKYQDTKLKNAISYELEEALGKIAELEKNYPEIEYASNWLNSP